MNNLDEVKTSSLENKEGSDVIKMNNDFKCLLCNEVFFDLEEFKLHDLRHSLEEADEDASNIEQLILPFGLKSCEICDEKFTCDEELINHSMNHDIPETDGLENHDIPETDDLENHDIPESTSDNEEYASPNNEESPTNYQILRQQVITDKNGKTDVRFILIDHQGDQTKEYATTIQESKFKPRPILPSFNKTSAQKGFDVLKKIPKKLKQAKRRLSSDDDLDSVLSDNDSIFNVRKKDVVNKRPKRSNAVNTRRKKVDNSVKKIESDDDDVEFLYEESGIKPGKSRRCKQLALKKKIWNKKTVLPPPERLKDCPYCNKSFGLMEDFKKHVSSHSNKQISYRKPAYLANLNKNPIKQEVRASESEPDSDVEKKPVEYKEIVCGICDRNFSRRKILRRHLYNVHMLDENRVNFYLQKVVHTTATYHKCKVCKKQFYRKTNLMSHDCTPAISVVCDICNHKLATKAALKKHLLYAHKLGMVKVNAIMDALAGYNAKLYKKINPEEEVLICSSDGRTISKKKGSKFIIPEGIRCHKCYRAFTEEEELVAHKCSRNIKVWCDICKYYPSSKYNLKRHLRCIHKLTLNEADYAVVEFKRYNERFRILHPDANKIIKNFKKKSKAGDSSKSSQSKDNNSSKVDDLNSSGALQSTEVNDSESTSMPSTKESDESKKTSSVSSKKLALSSTAKKREAKMISTSKAQFRGNKNTTAQKLVARSKNYFGKNSLSTTNARSLRSRKNLKGDEENPICLS